MIRFEGVSKAFGNSRVLRNLNFTVDEGTTLALLGLSGSGKTTALKIIAGLQVPDSGKVSVQGIEISPNTIYEVRSNIGYVIQDGGLFPHLTAQQNLALVGKESRWSDQKTAERISELLDLARLPKELLHKFPRQLSGGQKQRFSLIRALMKNPRVLLLDEPLGALDPITRAELQKELRDLCKQLRKTVVLVTHDLYEAGYLADQIVLLKEGEALQKGTLKELIESPADSFVQKFVQSQVHTASLVQ